MLIGSHAATLHGSNARAACPTGGIRCTRAIQPQRAFDIASDVCYGVEKSGDGVSEAS
jgi:hypothetical protein